MGQGIQIRISSESIDAVANFLAADPLVIRIANELGLSAPLTRQHYTSIIQRISTEMREIPDPTSRQYKKLEHVYNLGQIVVSAEASERSRS